MSMEWWEQDLEREEMDSMFNQTPMRTDYPLPTWVPCFIRHWWVRLNFSHNYNGWHSNFEHLSCWECGATILSANEDKE